MTSHAVEHKLTEEAKAAAGIMEILRARNMDDDAVLVNEGQSHRGRRKV